MIHVNCQEIASKRESKIAMFKWYENRNFTAIIISIHFLYISSFEHVYYSTP